MAMIAGVLGKPFAPLLAAHWVEAARGGGTARAAPRAGRHDRAGRLSGGRLTQGAGGAAAGCANAALAPSINAATIRLLNRHGVEVVIAPGAGCCGSLEHHLGRETGAFAKARANVDAWTREIEGEGSMQSSSPSRAAARR